MGCPWARKCVGERQHLVHGFENRTGVENLRADVAAHALGHQVAELPRAFVDGGRAGDGDAEFVLAEAGGNVGMGDGVHVGVDADGEAGLLAEARGLGVDQREFRLRFAVEAVDAAFQRVFHFRGGLADAGEDDLRGVAAGLKDAVQLAAGDDVETRAGLGQQRQHGQRGVGLHRVANGVRQGAERLRVSGIVLAGSPGWNRRRPECRRGARGRPAGPAHSSSRFANRRTFWVDFGAEFPVWHRELLGPRRASRAARSLSRAATVCCQSLEILLGGVGEFEIAVEIEDVAAAARGRSRPGPFPRVCARAWSRYRRRGCIRTGA